jgi:adenylate cyclase class 2
MPDEIEAKMKVDDLDAVRERLRGLKARRVGTELETNTFFDTPDSSLVRAGKGLRIREARGLETGRVRHVVTFKGPQQKGDLKNREEIEFSVDDGPAAVALLKAVGFEPILSFEKRRETWELDDCEIVLDELPILGTFIEVEGPGEAAVLRVREKLGLAGFPMITAGYATMLARHLRGSGGTITSARFNA